MIKYKALWMGIVGIGAIGSFLLFKYPSDDVIRSDVELSYVHNSLMKVYEILKANNYEGNRDSELIMGKLSRDRKARLFLNPLTNRPIYVRKLDGVAALDSSQPFIYTEVRGSHLPDRFFALSIDLEPMYLNRIEPSGFFTISAPSEAEMGNDRASEY